MSRNARWVKGGVMVVLLAGLSCSEGGASGDESDAGESGAAGAVAGSATSGSGGTSGASGGNDTGGAGTAGGGGTAAGKGGAGSGGTTGGAGATGSGGTTSGAAGAGTGGIGAGGSSGSAGGGQGGSGGTFAGLVPTIATMTPSTMPLGSSDFEIVLTGSDFVSDHMISFDSHVFATTFVSDSELRAVIFGAALGGTPRFVRVMAARVADPGLHTNVMMFEITPEQ